MTISNNQNPKPRPNRPFTYQHSKKNANLVATLETEQASVELLLERLNLARESPETRPARVSQVTQAHASSSVHVARRPFGSATALSLLRRREDSVAAPEPNHKDLVVAPELHPIPPPP
jgi:hypothetical protein